MASKWFTGGVVAASRERIQFDFILDGVRYRPTIKRPPSEANLRRARERLEVIKRQIESGTFSFEEEFPDYRFLRRLSGTSKARLCTDVFDDYLSHCEARLKRDDMAAATVSSYRKALNGVSRPKIGHIVFSQVRYSHLLAIADGHAWSKKAYNNVTSVLKRAFDFGYRDRPPHENPAHCLRCARLRKNERAKIDPFPIHDAEVLIAAIHRDWGEAQGNYDEFRFFTGLRPSEQIALALSDLDLVNGIISINKARVYGVDRCTTKTGDDRRIRLCPRALLVLKRQLRLRARLEAAGKVDHDHVFISRVRRAHLEPAPSTGSVAQNAAIIEAALSTTVHRTPFFSELESDDWQECALGRQAAWAQHCNDAPCLCGLGRRIGGNRYRNDQEFVEPDTSCRSVARSTQPRISFPATEPRRGDFAYRR
jgi:integrase